MMFKKNKGTGSTPSTPKIGNVSLPGDDMIMRTSSPFKRLMSFTRRSTTPALVEKVAPTPATKLREVYPPPSREHSRTRVDSLSAEKPKHRARSDSSSSATMPAWGGAPLANAKIDHDEFRVRGRASSMKPVRHGSYSDTEGGAHKVKLYPPSSSSVFTQSSTSSGHRSRRLSSESQRASSLSARPDPNSLSRLKGVNVTRGPMKGDPELEVHVPWPTSCPPSRTQTPQPTKPKLVHVTKVPMKLDDGPSPPRHGKFRFPEVPQTEGPVTLNWQLVDFESRMRGPRLRFDIMFPIEGYDNNLCYCKRNEPWSRLPTREREQPISGDATLRRMDIRCENIPGWADWQILVVRSDGIRCIDIFNKIYEEFNRVLTVEEWGHIAKEERDSVIAAFKYRCKHGPGLESYERGEGPRRVDVLKRATFFRGLTWSPKGDTNWVLHFYPVLHQR